jgi:hypothetical protein
MIMMLLKAAELHVSIFRLPGNIIKIYEVK